MALTLTPEMLEGAYEFLRVTPPFKRCKLPHADEVEFVVGNSPNCCGWYTAGETAKHRIMISARNIGHTVSLMATMAHEMIHLHQCHAKRETRNAEHNAAFLRAAALVCKYHGFDPKLF